MVTESRGVPSVSVITSSFTRAANLRAASLGMPGARLVVLPLAVSYRERRAVLKLAVIDVRRSAVLWHGAVAGAAAEAASPSALTTLALRVAAGLAPS